MFSANNLIIRQRKVLDLSTTIAMRQEPNAPAYVGDMLNSINHVSDETNKFAKTIEELQASNKNTVEVLKEATNIVSSMQNLYNISECYARIAQNIFKVHQGR